VIGWLGWCKFSVGAGWLTVHRRCLHWLALLGVKLSVLLTSDFLLFAWIIHFRGKFENCFMESFPGGKSNNHIDYDYKIE
jgi:hypothetical protein